MTAGTIFHKSKIPLHKWFWLVFLMASQKKGVSASNAQKLLGIRNYRTTWLMMQKIRWVMHQRDQRYQLAGTVEADESYYGGVHHGGKKIGKTGRGSGQTPVLITVENRKGKPGYGRMKVLPSIEEEAIGQGVATLVKAGSTIKSDGLSSYNGIVTRGFRHDKRVIGPDRAQSTKVLPWVHILASNSKRFLLATYHHVSPKYLERYLAEFSYRFNRRRWGGQLFERLLYACLATAPTDQLAISA